jgi:hypothetical protein
VGMSLVNMSINGGALMAESFSGRTERVGPVRRSTIDSMRGSGGLGTSRHVSR